jgi:O-antigen ligase
VVGGGLVAAVALLALTPLGRGVAGEAVARVGALSDTAVGSTGTHLALARVGLAITADHPLLGVGQEVFPEVAQTYARAHLPAAQASLLDGYRSESPHDALLSISSGAGVPALLAYLGFVVAVGVLVVRQRPDLGRDAVPLLAVIVGHLVTDLFMTPEVSSSALFWVVLGTACARPPRTPGQSTA